MAKPGKKYLLWCAALAVILACAPSGSAPPAPALDANLINTMIVQTGNAALTQTVAALPTSSLTATFTSTPRATDTPEPTATATVIFRFFTPTPKGQATGTITSDQPYACQLISQSPANGKEYAPRTDFDAVWKVKNIGKKDWDGGSVDYIYLNGDKFHKVEGYDLKKTVKVGETVELIVDMIAPKNNGSYSTNWTLRAGSNNFCTLSLTIVVR
jgi:hypothetical protein